MSPAPHKSPLRLILTLALTLPLTPACNQSHGAVKPPVDRKAALIECMTSFYDQIPADENPGPLNQAKANFNRCLKERGVVTTKS